MKTTFTNKLIVFLVLIPFALTSLTAQVGINTVTPQGGAMLDITSSDKGLLIPRVDISNLSTIFPITGGSTESLLVYNTNTTTGKGFYYWNGSIWINLNSDDWKTTGNTGTIAGTNFIGTTDAQPLSFKTNNVERFWMSQNGQFRSTLDGSASIPNFTWKNDNNTGFYSIGADILGFTTGGTEKFRLGTTEAVFNDISNDYDFRVETDGNANAIFVDGNLNAIGVGTPTPNGILDMSSTTMGMIPPRVSLTSTIVTAPVVNPQGTPLVAGTCVYNINTAGAAPNNVAPGLYFWNGSRWVAFVGSSGGLDWTLTGNSGTSAGTNFLGTTDAVPLVISTNSSPRMIVNAGTGEVYVNNLGYFADFMLQSTSTGTQKAIGGFGSGTGDTYYGQNTGGGLVGRFLGTGDGFRSLSNSASGNGVQATGGAWTSYSYPGVSSGGVFAGTYGASGIGLSATGTGLAGLGQGRLTIVVDPGGSGIAGSGDNLGVFGYAGYGDVANANRGNASAEFILDADNDVLTNTGDNGSRARAKLAGFDNVTPDGSLSNRDSYYGGYFSGGSESSGTPSYAYVGMRYNTNGDGDGGGTDYKVIGSGSNSTLIDGPDGKPRIMFSPEAPEILFQDFGVGQLNNGIVRINLDPILKGSLYIDNEHPLKVYVTLEGECNGIYVTNKSKDGFTVKELQGGTSNAAFSWQIVASRADRVAQNGTMVSKHVGVRLPIGPGPLAQKVLKTETLKADDNYKIEKPVKNELVQSQTNNNQNNTPNPSVAVKKGQAKN